jgi:malonyl-CoA/methylmalonyl-CoA synthetase
LIHLDIVLTPGGVPSVVDSAMPHNSYATWIRGGPGEDDMNWYRTLESRWASGSVAIETSTEVVSYADLADRVHHAAGWIREVGLYEGDILALQMPRTPSLVALHLAALSQGVCTLPLNTTYPSPEITYYLRDSGAKVAVLSAEVAREVRIGPQTSIWSSDDVEAALRTARPRGPETADLGDRPGALLYTSGTTGRPKGAVISQRAIAGWVDGLRAHWKFTPSDRLLHALPLFHIHGLFVAQDVALASSSFTLWMDRFDAMLAMRTLQQRAISVFMGVPTFYGRILGLPSAMQFDLSCMRLFTSGSAPLPQRDHEAFAQRFGHTIVERYGMTEIGIVLSNPVDGRRLAGTVGRPLPGVQVQIIDEDQGPVESGQIGELWIRSPWIFDGYHNDPTKTDSALVDGWMKTGDLARQGSDGYYAIVGRRTDMILSGGLNVYPAEVEDVLLAQPGIVEAAVVGLPDGDLGERVTAAVTVNAMFDLDTALSGLRRVMAAYKCPKDIHVMDTLPRNAMGKVDKRRLVEILMERRSRDDQGDIG